MLADKAEKSVTVQTIGFVVAGDGDGGFNQDSS
jgi:hypothetical protein